MAPAAVVKDFDVFEDRVRELQAGVPPLPVKQLGLHAPPERLGDGVVVGVANGSQRRQQPGPAGPFGEGPRGELGGSN